MKIFKVTVSWLTETRHSFFFVFERLVANRIGIQALPKLYGFAKLDVGFF